MTYDFHGAWDPLANHNCPLYPSAGADTTLCVDWAYRQYHETLGVPASKLNLGVPFYGRTYAGCAGLNGPHSGPDTVFFPATGAAYYDIVPALGRFTRRWDEKACVPYLVNADARVFVSYDDEESIRAKARYVVDHDVRGVIIWEITGDYLARRNHAASGRPQERSRSSTLNCSLEKDTPMRYGYFDDEQSRVCHRTARRPGLLDELSRSAGTSAR